MISFAIVVYIIFTKINRFKYMCFNNLPAVGFLLQNFRTLFDNNSDFVISDRPGFELWISCLTFVGTAGDILFLIPSILGLHLKIINSSNWIIIIITGKNRHTHLGLLHIFPHPNLPSIVISIWLAVSKSLVDY